MTYHIAVPEKRCDNCYYASHDDDRMEVSCAHPSPATGVPADRIVESNGCCEYWMEVK